MKTAPIILAAFMTHASWVRAETDPTDTPGWGATTTSRSATALPTQVPTIPRIIGDIPDGAQAQPQPASRSGFAARQRDVLDSKVHNQGDRTITIQKIKPIALPPPPAPQPRSPIAATDTTAFTQRLAAYRAAHPGTGAVSLGATVYRTHLTPPRTLVRYWPTHGGDPVTFWSSADFALISGIRSFAASDGRKYDLFMSWSTSNTNPATDLSDGTNQLPDIPVFPIGPATFTIVGTAPADPSILVPIQSLHDLYNREFWHLKIAYDGRERARHQHEADLKANPPQPKNVVLNYWTTDTPAHAKKGGAK